MLLLSTCLGQDAEGKDILCLRGSPVLHLKSVIDAVYFFPSQDQVSLNGCSDGI